MDEKNPNVRDIRSGKRRGKLEGTTHYDETPFSEEENSPEARNLSAAFDLMSRGVEHAEARAFVGTLGPAHMVDLLVDLLCLIQFNGNGEGSTG